MNSNSLTRFAWLSIATALLTVAERPADEEHPYGHGKAEYFSSGFEGALILVAAIGIAIAAVQRLLHPAPLESISLGLAVSVGASLLNLATALLLLRAGKNTAPLRWKPAPIIY